MLNKKLKDQKGFTIIEVMIVLAIAGLIMLIVFLAVPALQRTSRNTQRKNDAGNLASAISTWISNNNGSLPGTESGSFVQSTCTTDMNSIVTSIKLGYYSNSNILCNQNTSAPSYCPSSGTSSSCNADVTTENIYYVPGNVCSGNSPTTTNATTRSYVILYEVESGSSASGQCIEG